MSQVNTETARSIVGISIRTNNREAAETIPAVWGRFFGEGIPARIAGKVSDDVYAVYTGFVAVSSTEELEAGLDTVMIPAGNYHRFDVPENSNEQVFPTWMSIWSNNDLGKTFVCDFEQYSPTGEISINVGTDQSA